MGLSRPLLRDSFRIILRLEVVVLGVEVPAPPELLVAVQEAVVGDSLSEM